MIANNAYMTVLEAYPHNWDNRLVLVLRPYLDQKPGKVQRITLDLDNPQTLKALQTTVRRLKVKPQPKQPGGKRPRVSWKRACADTI